jgi:hypothetical protein
MICLRSGTALLEALLKIFSDAEESGPKITFGHSPQMQAAAARDSTTKI